MPKTIKLSWQPGVGNRQGRWRKIHRGTAYHFPGGNGKSDREAYDAAWAAWEIKKAEIDRTAPRRHQKDYERCIDQWEKVLAWSNQYGDREHANQAELKLADLRHRFTALKLVPLRRTDWFEANFDPVVDPKWLAEIVMAQMPAIELLEGPQLLVKPDQKILDSIDGSPSRIHREIWRDRLAVQERKTVPDDESVGAYIKMFLAQKEQRARAGQITTGRIYALRLHLDYFRDWLGKDTGVTDIDGRTLTEYHAHLLEKMASGKWGERTAGHHLTTVKSFVHWLWQIEAISALPRIMDGRSKILTINKPAPKIVVFTKEEIKSLLSDAPDRTKLYILLMLNCGMTQKDISDLLVSEVDWKEGRIIRKRSKTSDEKNVPVVNYKLWPETFRLLQQERSTQSPDRALLNSNGGPLWLEEITKDGKYKKNDNVKNAFDRLRTAKKIKEPRKSRRKATKRRDRAVKATIDKPMKCLKKTSASLLRDNATFSALEGLFLGHAPQSMSDRHYARVPQNLLDQAVTWLGQEYGLIEVAPAVGVLQGAALVVPPVA